MLPLLGCTSITVVFSQAPESNVQLRTYELFISRSFFSFTIFDTVDKDCDYTTKEVEIKTNAKEYIVFSAFCGMSMKTV